ncbi:MAG: DUF6048 family protein [Bacteroidota bacterium]
MKRQFIYIFISLWSAILWAQDTVPDTTIIERTKFIRPSLYFDYGKAITKLIGYEDKLEVAGSVLLLGQYEIIGELGNATLSPPESYTNGNYSASGNYYRIGAGYLGTFKSDFAIGLSARYAVSKFSDQGFIEIQGESGIDNSYSRPFGSPDLEARWWELVLTSEKKIKFNKENLSAWYNDVFSIGFFLRMRFLVTYDKRSPIDVYSVPGYGKTIDNSTPAFNLFVKAYLF